MYCGDAVPQAGGARKAEAGEMGRRAEGPGVGHAAPRRCPGSEVQAREGSMEGSGWDRGEGRTVSPLHGLGKAGPSDFSKAV